MKSHNLFPSGDIASLPYSFSLIKPAGHNLLFLWSGRSDFVGFTAWLLLLGFSVHPVILDDCSVSEYHVFLQHCLLLRVVTLLDCHEQLLNNNSLLIGYKMRRKMLESYKHFWRHKIQFFMSGIITLWLLNK